MLFDFTPLREALYKIKSSKGHGGWQYIARKSGLSSAGVHKIAKSDGRVENESWEKLYKAFPDEIPVPPWYKSNAVYVKSTTLKIPGLGARLKDARESADLSVAQAAEKLNLEVNDLKSWESDQTSPDLLMLVKICDLYDINAHLLLTGSPAPIGLSEAVQFVLKSEPGRGWTIKEVTEAVNKLIESGQFKIQF